MIEIRFTEEEREVLNYERYHHPHPHVQKKMEALWLKSLGYAPKEIMEMANISKTTLYSYLKEYRAGWIEKLKELNFLQVDFTSERQYVNTGRLGVIFKQSDTHLLFYQKLLVLSLSKY